MRLRLITFYFVLLVIPAYAQSENDFIAINTQIWGNFTKAFETLDYNLFESLHGEDLIRVSGDSRTLRDKTQYLKGYKNRWQDKQIKQTISFRFLERIVSGDKASERGIYKLTRNPNTKFAQSYYGQFHVILRKKNGVWEILVDYDSSEKNTINEISYLNAFGINDFKKYLK